MLIEVEVFWKNLAMQLKLQSRLNVNHLYKSMF